MTTSVWDELAAETEPLIVNGRYVIDGKRYTRVTTFIGALDNAYGLSAWKMREVAKGIAGSGSPSASLSLVLTTSPFATRKSQRVAHGCRGPAC